MGEIGSMVMEHFSSFFAASSAINQAIRFGNGEAREMGWGGGGGGGGTVTGGFSQRVTA